MELHQGQPDSSHHFEIWSQSDFETEKYFDIFFILKKVKCFQAETETLVGFLQLTFCMGLNLGHDVCAQLFFQPISSFKLFSVSSLFFFLSFLKLCRFHLLLYIVFLFRMFFFSIFIFFTNSCGMGLNWGHKICSENNFET